MYKNKTVHWTIFK